MEREDHLDRIKLVTGGQTGVDRAMLDFCLDHGIRCGGWCPENRLAEDGTIDLRYPVRELPKATYRKRTAANVKESDATVIIYHREMDGGTLKSFEFAQKEKKLFLLLDMSILDPGQAASRLLRFIERYRPGTLNFSGPRKSEWQEGYKTCYTILQQLFGKPKKTPSADANGVEISSKG